MNMIERVEALQAMLAELEAEAKKAGMADPKVQMRFFGSTGGIFYLSDGPNDEAPRYFDRFSDGNCFATTLTDLRARMREWAAPEATP